MRENAVSEYRKEINLLEKSIITLLDEFVLSLQKSKTAEQIENRASGLAKKAQELASELREADKEELNEKSEHLDRLISEADELIEAVPDAILNHEQKIWAGRIERLNEKLVKLKKRLKEFEGLDAGNRKTKIENEMKKTIKSAKKEIKRAEHAILHKKHAQEHHVYLSLLKIRKAMNTVRRHISYTATEFARVDRREPLIRDRSREIINAFLEQQKGKMFIDHYSVEMISNYGEKVSWKNDEISNDALLGIFENSNMFEIIQMRDSKNKAINASFRIVDGTAGAVVEMNGGCRTIFDDRIEFRKTEAFVSI